MDQPATRSRAYAATIADIRKCAYCQCLAQPLTKGDTLCSWCRWFFNNPGYTGWHKRQESRVIEAELEKGSMSLDN